MVSGESAEDAGEGPVLLETSQVPYKIQFLKVPPSIAKAWNSAPSGSIVGIALSEPATNMGATNMGRSVPIGTTQMGGLGAASCGNPGEPKFGFSGCQFNSLITAAGAPNQSEPALQKLSIGKFAPTPHLHLFQAQKRSRPTDTPVPISDPRRPPTFGQFGPDESGGSGAKVRVLASLDGSFALQPLVDRTFRLSLKRQLANLTEGSHRTLMEKHSAADSDGSLHLFKYYANDGDNDMVDSKPQRPTVSSKDRGRLSGDQLKDLIFKIFESKGDDGVMLKEFLMKLNVSQVVLKTALDEIGECVTRNGQRPKWYLKREYAEKP